MKRINEKSYYILTKEEIKNPEDLFVVNHDDGYYAESCLDGYYIPVELLHEPFDGEELEDILNLGIDRGEAEYIINEDIFIENKIKKYAGEFDEHEVEFQFKAEVNHIDSEYVYFELVVKY